MSNHDPLRDALRNRADQLGDTSPLTLDDVKGRARGIRRRRAAVTGLAAAAVLAVAVPMGLAVTDGVGTDPGNPPVAGPSVTPSEDPSYDTGVKDGVLTTEVDARSYAPTIPYLYDGKVTMPDGDPIRVEGEWDQLAPLGEAVVVADAGRQELRVIGTEGTVAATYPSTGELAGSADGSLVLYATPEGRLAVLTQTEQQDLPAVPQLQTPVPVGIEGSDSCDPEADGGCVVYVRDAGERPASYSLTSKGIINPLGDYRTLHDVSADGWVSGVVSVDDLEPGSCSEVRADAFDDRPKWSTCEHTVDTFSRDSSLVVGLPAYLDGSGAGTLALLDATDGSVLAEWTNNEETQAFVGSTAWDEDGTLLATVFEQGSWSLMRFSPDGGLSKVQDLEGGDDVTPPLVLGES